VEDVTWALQSENVPNVRASAGDDNTPMSMVLALSPSHRVANLEEVDRHLALTIVYARRIPAGARLVERGLAPMPELKERKVLLSTLWGRQTWAMRCLHRVQLVSATRLLDNDRHMLTREASGQ
jgi:hypothetical protein